MDRTLPTIAIALALLTLALTLPLLSTGQAAAFVVVALVGALVLWRWDA